MPKRKASSGASSLDAGGKQPVPVQKLGYHIRSDSTKEAVDWMGSVFRHHTQTVSTTASTTATASTTPTTTSSSPLHLPNAAFGGFVDMTTTTSFNKLANTLSLSRKSTQIAQEVDGVRQQQLRDTQNQFSSDHPCVVEILPTVAVEKLYFVLIIIIACPFARNSASVAGCIGSEVDRRTTTTH